MVDRHEVYFAKLEEQIDEWRKRLDALAVKAERATADVKHAYEKALEERKAKLALARHKLEALRHIGSEKWEEGKATIESFWKEARSVFERPEPPAAP